MCIDEKQVVFYSTDDNSKAKAKRKAALVKAWDLVNNPSKYNKTISYGVMKYMKNLVSDPNTGEIMTTRQKPFFDEEKLYQEEKFDGYYAIVTSEWKKNDLEAHPVYLSRNDHIQVHFIICFVALVIARFGITSQKQIHYPFYRGKLEQSIRRPSQRKLVCLCPC
jgi:hypothetical protein